MPRQPGLDGAMAHAADRAFMEMQAGPWEWSFPSPGLARLMEEAAMELRDGELKVYYLAPGPSGTSLDRRLDDALRECLAQFGYEMWASGTDLETGVRDLAFQKKEES